MPERNRKYNGKYIALIVSLIAMVVVMILTSFHLRSYVERSVHDERVSYLTEQTNSTANLLSKTLAQYQNYAVICSRTISGELKPGESIAEYMNEVQEKLYLKNVRLITIDQSCTWYGEQGTSGRITAIENYASDTPFEVAYMTTGVDVTNDSFVFRVRLEQPITVQTDTGSTQICYCAVICYMDYLYGQFSGSFPYRCNSFVVDDSGLMLFKKFKLGMLIDGSNIFSKYGRVEFLYGDTVEQQLEKIRARETTIGEFSIGDNRYFICTSPLSINDWYTTFVFSSDDLAAGSYISKIFLYIMAIGTVFSLGVIITALMIIGTRKKKELLDTERKANAYLEKASMAKSKFISNMSHDIRTPINGIMGMTMLAQAEKNPPKTQACLEKISISSKYLLSLVNDVLDMSSIESGKITITKLPLNLLTFLNDCAAIVSGQLQNRDVRFVTDFDRVKHPLVSADELHLRQIFINILGNAVKFTPAGGTICFKAWEESCTEDTTIVKFEIQDTGIGMEEEFLNHIWERFSQDKSDSRTKFKGTGLGMAITKDLVDLMGGEISVSSQKNVGSTFTVTFPLTVAVEEEESDAADDTGLQGIRILLAEDNEINFEIASELLSGEGAEVIPAENGRIALKKFSESDIGEIDIILMDIMMPEMDGLEATAAIRALTRADAKTIPIIAMTANALEDDIRATKEAGMNAHLSKPMDLGVLVKMVTALLRKERNDV